VETGALIARAVTLAIGLTVACARPVAEIVHDDPAALEGRPAYSASSVRPMPVRLAMALNFAAMARAT